MSYNSPTIKPRSGITVTPMDLDSGRGVSPGDGSSSSLDPSEFLVPIRTSSELKRATEINSTGPTEKKSKIKINTVETNIIRAAQNIDSQTPDISWTEEIEDKYQERRTYDLLNQEYLPPISFFGNAKTEKTIVDDFLSYDELKNWVSETPEVLNYASVSGIDYSNYVDGTKYVIDVNKLPAFDSLRGVGGSIYILRYFQLIDMVHDMCHKRGEESNAWASNDTTIKRVYKKLKESYKNDILWLKKNGIVPYIDQSLNAVDKKRELALFYSFIGLKPESGDTLNFYNLIINFNIITGAPRYKIKNDDFIPSEGYNLKIVRYLSLIFMGIGEVNKDKWIEAPKDEFKPCSNFLEFNIDYIRTRKMRKSYLESFKVRFQDFLQSSKKIILHVDAESNKTGLCGIIPKFCDYALGTDETSIEYTKEFSSKEYDAAFIQKSEKFADLLASTMDYSEKVNLYASKTPPTRTIILTAADKVFFNITYDRYNVKPYQFELTRILNCETPQEIIKLIKNRKISRISLLYFIWINFELRSSKLSRINKAKEAIEHSNLDLSVNNLALEAIKNIKKSGAPDKKTLLSANTTKRYDNFLIRYKSDSSITRLEQEEGIKLTINQAYGLDESSFGKDLQKRYNPFVDNFDELNTNSNLSHTSSLRAITHGEYFNENFKLVNDDLVRLARTTTGFYHRAWFKQIGDFGQALEFYGYTHNKFSKNSWPLFVSFDKLSAHLSSLFNPLACLESLEKDSVNKLQFYFKSYKVASLQVNTQFMDSDGEVDFGKVNYQGYNKQMYNKRIYNKRRYNISKRLKLMSHLELKNKLKSVGIKITKNVRGKRKYLTRKELENKALLFNKLQNTAKRMKIKLMYISRNGLYKYKTYKRLQKEINSKYKNSLKSNRKYKKPFVRNFNFG
jgi:hypothetical protein